MARIDGVGNFQAGFPNSIIVRDFFLLRSIRSERVAERDCLCSDRS